jgi:hypothetical protein
MQVCISSAQHMELMLLENFLAKSAYRTNDRMMVVHYAFPRMFDLILTDDPSTFLLETTFSSALTPPRQLALARVHQPPAHPNQSHPLTDTCCRQHYARNPSAPPVAHSLSERLTRAHPARALVATRERQEARPSKYPFHPSMATLSSHAWLLHLPSRPRTI